MTLNLVGVVCALASEARHLGPATRHQPLTSLADGTLLAVSGMGTTAAARSARALVGAGAGALVSWGMAGGLDPALAAGTVFLPAEVVSTEGEAVTTDPGWRERLGKAIRIQAAAAGGGAVGSDKVGSGAVVGPGPGPITYGKLLTARKAIGSPADKANLFRQTGAAAVDMESLAIAQIARDHQLPFIAVRVIVDSAADALPRAVTAAADSEGHLQVWRLMGELVRAPAQLAPLLRLAQRYRAANRSLAAVARVGLLQERLS